MQFMSIIKLEASLRKYYGLLTLLSVFLGFIFPQISILSPYVPFLLAILVFSMVIEHDISDFRIIIKHPKSVFSLVTSNFILYPIIGILFAYFTISSPDIYTGIILLCFAPSPVIAALWTEMSGGDGTIPLTTSLFSMLLSIGIYPIVLYFMGLASLNLSVDIFKLLALSIFVPAIIALLLRDKENKYIPLKRKFKVLSAFVALFIIVIAIANLSSKILPNELNIVFLLTILAIILLMAGFAYGYLLSRLFKVQKKNRGAFLYTSSMRDGIIPLSVSITYFSYFSTLAPTILLIVMPFLVTIVYQLIKE